MNFISDMIDGRFQARNSFDSHSNLPFFGASHGPVAAPNLVNQETGAQFHQPKILEIVDTPIAIPADRPMHGELSGRCRRFHISVALGVEIKSNDIACDCERTWVFGNY